MLSFESVKDILLDELRAKGYAPNAADVLPATSRLLAMVQASEEAAVAAALAVPAVPSVPVPTASVPGQKPSV